METNKNLIKGNFINSSPSFPNLSSLNNYGLSMNLKRHHVSKSESSDISQDVNLTVIATPKPKEDSNAIDYGLEQQNENKSNDQVNENNQINENNQVNENNQINENNQVNENNQINENNQVNENNQINENKPDMSFIDLLTNLKLLSHVKEYDKLTITNNSIDIDNNYFRDILRRFRGESHIDTLNFIEKMINCTEYYSNEFITTKNNDDLHKLKLLTEDLDNCKIGLNNLKVTYATYNIVICKIDIYLEQINTRINKNRN
jgi:hypothetical protein